jgi:hypothetical protein
MMTNAALVKKLKKEGYIVVTKGNSNHTHLFSEYHARKMAKDIRKDYKYPARAIKTSQVGMTGDSFWMVMYKIKRH